jgi:hypothetical protein
MSPYTPLDAFSDAEIYDLSDLVKGGTTGDANLPIEALFNQTNYLKNRLHRWEGIEVLTDNDDFNAADIGNLLLFNISDNKTFSLPTSQSLPSGTRIAIQAIIPTIKALTVQGSNPIIDGGISWVKWDDNATSGMYLHDGDKLILVAADDHWIVEKADGNFYNAGESFSGRKQARNSFVANGTTYNRSDIPRVTLFALSLGGGIVSDATWLSDPGGAPVYRGCYSSGNGSTTIRLPDERGLSDRHLDLGRGLDIYRMYNQAGGFEEEQLQKHDHIMHGKGPIPGGGGPYWMTNKNAGYSGGGSNALGGRQTVDPDMRTGDSVGTQNIVKNIGKIPLIRY